MIWLYIIIVFGYALTIILLSKESLTYPKTNLDFDHNRFSFTILVNFRNEQSVLPHLLQSVKTQNYDFSSIQWIFINDNSDDQSLEIVNSFQLRNPEIEILLIDRTPISNSAKKDGITQALELSKYNHIITTDADCILPKNWILSYNSIYNTFTDAHFIAAPIQLKQNKSILGTLQHQEMIALQLLTIGGFSFRQPFMCNGANMSFTKKAFNQERGYHGNKHISSGDDIFLLEKLAKKDVMKCHYLKNKDAIVTTFSKDRLNDIIAQRARWAQKGNETKSLLNKLVSFQVLAMSLLFVTSPIFWYFSIITDQMLIGLLLVKAFTDLMVLIIGDEFFEDVKWTFVPINYLIYPYLVLAIAVSSILKPIWHGRTINTPMSPQG